MGGLCTKQAAAVVAKNYFGVSETKLAEMFERRNKTILIDDFGGAQGLATSFKSSTTNGISGDSEATRITECGPNILERKAPARFIDFVIEGFEDRTIQILAVAAIVSIILGMTVPDEHTGKVERSEGWIEGVAIIVSITVVVGVTSINNFAKARKFEEMEKEQTVKELQVLRNGEKTTIMSDRVVVGDILFLTYGMEMSVDGIVLRAEDLKMNESAITGEPILIKKSAIDDPFVVSGTSVEEGAGMILVTAVGMASFQGRTKAAIDNAGKAPKAAPKAEGDKKEGEEEAEAEEEDDDDATPMQRKLDDLATKIGHIGLIFAVIMILGLSIKQIILIKTQGRKATAISFVNFVIIGIALVVVAIPEGLPLAVTIALAFAMKAMMADQCLVRILAACETMGAATAVCSDKTGTLTMNSMTCVQGCVGSHEFIIDGIGLIPRHEGVTRAVPASFKLPALASGVVSELCKAISLNSTAGEQVIDGQKVMKGNPTEQGLLTLVNLFEPGFYIRAREYYQGRVRQFPFNSTKKRMTTIVQDDDGTQKVYMKGDPEAILAACDRIVGPDGQVTPLTAETRALMLAIQKDMACQGNRTIGVAFCATSNLSMDAEEEPEVPYVLLAILGIQDPLRREVPEAVHRCHTSGLIVRMVTGDNIDTAKSIASKCHIYEDNGYDIAMLGIDFRKMYDTNRDELRKILPRLRVLARSSPTDKFYLVQMLKDDGEVVAVTGDGTNDAPALKLADVGFAMKTGTDIAKGAAHMILLDDNFATVVTAIKWGRSVNDNVKKFLQFQLSINVSGVLLTLIGSLYSPTSKEPFTPVQLLWLNLIMDTLAAVSLATELPEDRSLDRHPEYKASPLLSRRMTSFVLTHGLWQFAVIIVLLVNGHRWFDIVEEPDVCNRDFVWVDDGTGTLAMTAQEQWCRDQCVHHGGHVTGTHMQCQQGRSHETFLFNVFIWFQVFNVPNARKLHGEMNPLEGVWTRSRVLILVFAVIGGLQAIAVEFGGDFINTNGLSGKMWGISLAFAASEVLIGILQRFIPVQDFIPADVVARQKRDDAEYFRLTGKHRKAYGTHAVAVAPPEKKRRTRSSSPAKKVDSTKLVAAPTGSAGSSVRNEPLA